MLTFDVELCTDKEFSLEDSNDIKYWLFGNIGYSRLEVLSEEFNNYYFICTLKPKDDYFITGGFNGLSFQVECSSPYAWKKVKYNKQNLRIKDGGFTIVNNSKQIGNVLPFITFELEDVANEFSLKNITMDTEMKFSNLTPCEKITIDCSSGIIKSYIKDNITNEYKFSGLNRFPNFNRNFIELTNGINEFKLGDGVKQLEIIYDEAVRLGGLIG